LIIIGALLASTIIIYIVLRSSFLIVKMLGASGINGLSRIIGFIVIAIGVEFIVSAIKSAFNVA
jgi:multiple antibiotic resistance protein